MDGSARMRLLGGGIRDVGVDIGAWICRVCMIALEVGLWKRLSWFIFSTKTSGSHQVKKDHGITRDKGNHGFKNNTENTHARHPRPQPTKLGPDQTTTYVFIGPSSNCIISSTSGNQYSNSASASSGSPSSPSTRTS